MDNSGQSVSITYQLGSAIAGTLRKMRTPHFMITFATIFLLVYVALINFEANAGLVLGMFTFSQFMVVALAYIVVRHGVYDGKDFEEDQEFGYEDYNCETGEFTRSLRKVSEQLKDSQD